MINLPAREMGTANVPAFTLCVRSQDERPLSCTNQYPYFAHPLLLPELRADFAGGFFTTSAVTPPVEVAPAAFNAAVVMHPTHIELLRSLHPIVSLI